MSHLLDIQYYNTFILKGKNDSDVVEFHVEESRIKGGFNDASVDLGVRAHTTAEFSGKEERPNALIHSGIFNSKTGVNNINQFSIGQNITKALDSQDGSIQKLYAEDTNLNVFQEEKVSWIAIDKNIIYTAEGSPQVTTANQVFGQTVSYNGNYGIGKNPESFAYYAGRKYFVDKPKGAVLRLSRDGITEISNYGMRSYFLKELKPSTIKQIHGAWDIEKRNYILSYQTPNVNGVLEGPTLAFDESANGWVSFYDYYPKFGGSIDGNFYTFHNGLLYKQHDASSNTFYGGNPIEASISIIINENPSVNKNFYTINYEGAETWDITSIASDLDTGVAIDAFNNAYQDNDTAIFVNSFKKFDNKYSANIINATPAKENEVIFGGDISGLKGYFLNVTLTNSSTNNELFSVSTNYNINTY
jgi:hypothetical protein